MNGVATTVFTVREVPLMIRGMLDYAGWSVEEADAFILHQANRDIQDYFVKKLKLPPEKVPYSIQEYGNTSSASIPLAVVDHLRRPGMARSGKYVLAGFGVGLSWAAAACTLEDPIIPPVISVPEDSAGA